MTLEEIEKLIAKHFYIIFNETFVHDDGELFLKRYVVKHPLLRPQFIIEDDQIQGFKRLSKKMTSLEQFPIYIEVEGVKLEKGNVYIENIDVYSEANLSVQSRLSDVIHLAQKYSDHVNLDRILRLGNASKESIVIFSKIPDILLAEFETIQDDDDMEEDLMVLSEKFDIDLPHIIDNNFKYFGDFIRHLDNIIVKKLALPEIIDIDQP
ncbi:hypothetical protein DID80_02025 [Candidatus Marinamargulisbacteria bacterium SCGC AAA071-K20]|nr:hypothetical protein DID80_02025 [Candidatus Marinamargulisbacteria bacterium SCGC AAA071-K20]